MNYALFLVDLPEDSQIGKQYWKDLLLELLTHIEGNAQFFQRQTVGVWQISGVEESAETIYQMQESCRHSGLTSKFLLFSEKPSWFVVPPKDSD